MAIYDKTDNGDKLITGVRVEGLPKLLRDLKSMGVEVDDLKAAFSKIAAEGAAMAAAGAPQRSGALARTARGNRAKSKAVVTVGRARVKYAGRVNYEQGFSETGYHWIQRVDERLSPRAPGMLEAEIIRLLKQKGLA